jgi:hypothetical protein
VNQSDIMKWLTMFVAAPFRKSRAIGDAELVVWREKLATIDDTEAAFDALRSMIDELTWWPSIADFTERYHTAERALAPKREVEAREAERTGVVCFDCGLVNRHTAWCPRPVSEIPEVAPEVPEPDEAAARVHDIRDRLRHRDDS